MKTMTYIIDDSAYEANPNALFKVYLQVTCRCGEGQIYTHLLNAYPTPEEAKEVHPEASVWGSTYPTHAGERW